MPTTSESRADRARDPRAEHHRPLRRRRLWAVCAAVLILTAVAWPLGLPLSAGFAAILAAALVAAVAGDSLKRAEKWSAEEIERRRRSEHAAKAADRAKTDFLAKVSHELRTPLNAIVGNTDLLLSGRRSPQDQRRLAVVNASAETLLALVDDLLDFADAERGRLRLARVDFGLRELVAQVEAMIAPQATDKGLDLVFEVEPEVPDSLHGDPVRLRQVLFNLLHNAVKFTRRGSVEVLVARRGEEISFSVRDTGIGISSEDRDRIFETFVQADSSSARKFEGTGLGLAIARELVELMGGTLGVESERRRGSTFWFLLPLAPAAAPAEGRRDSEQPRSGPGAFHVLVVEDEATNRVLAASHLAALGFRATEVADGHRALELLADGGFDAVLMDCAMPGLDGYETTRRLRRAEAEHGRPRTVVIAVTAHAQQGERDRCLAVGMDDYLTKPYRGRDLHAVLQRWLPVAVEAASDSSAAPPAVARGEHEPRAARSAVDPETLDRLRRLGDQTGEGVLDKLISSYLRDSRRWLAAIDRAFTEADLSALAKAVHALVGISAAIGADELAACCRALEEGVRSSGFEACKEGVSAMVSEHRRVTAELEDVICSQSDARSSDTNPSRKA